MPRIAQTIPDVHDAITRPVALDVARQLGKLLKLPKTTQILIPGLTDQAAQAGSTLDYEGESINLPFNGKLTIEHTEPYIEERVLTDVVYQNDAPYFFEDKKLGVRLKPIYSSNELVLNVSARSRDRITAQRFRDDIKMRTSMMRKENLHELTYHYGIPKAFLDLLKTIYQLREAVAGYGDTLDEWLTKSLVCRATNLSTLKGTEPLLVIPEHQTRVLGWFDFSAAPEASQKDGEGPTFTSSFEYRVQYDKVIGVVAEWPLVVHNQVIPLPYRGDFQAVGKLPHNPAYRTKRLTLSRGAYDHFAPKRLYDAQPIDGIRYPVFDDWLPHEVAPDTSTVYTTMLQVDVNDPQAVISLFDLGDVTIDHQILDYMLLKPQALSQLGQSAVYVTLYEGKSPKEGSFLEIDDQLTIRTKAPLDPRKSYHLRIALLTDLFALSSEAFDRLRMHGTACIKILLTLQGKFDWGNCIPKLVGGKLVPKAVLKDIAARINAYKAPYQTGVEYRFLTVGNFVISTHRSEDYAGHENQRGPTHPGQGDACESGTAGSEDSTDGQPIRPCGEPADLYHGQQLDR